jgi:SAM-dependent methyltransferase
VFTSPIEYPLGIIAACLVRPLAQWSWRRRDLARDLFWAVAAIALGLASRAALQAVGFQGASFGVLVAAVALPVMLATLHWPHARRFAMMLAAVFACAPTLSDVHVLHASRNFFGVLRVAASGNREYTELFHGNTLHGAQSRDPARRREPLTYYWRKGPAGQVFHTLGPQLDRARIAVIGLGAGTLASYAEAGQHWTFYEIDPDVVTIASDTHYFSYLAAARSPVRLVVDDGRLAVGREAPGTFAVIVLDAFSSDAIPVHLLTTEALALYARALRPGGVLLMNVSNRYLDLASVVAAGAHAVNLPGLVQFDQLTEAEHETRAADSTWILLGSDTRALRPFAGDTRWRRLAPPRDVRPWSDDFSNLYGAIMWRR